MPKKFPNGGIVEGSLARAALAFELLRQFEKRTLSPCRRNESHPKWNVVRTETGRNRKPAEVQEVHEVGVSTKIRVELNRVG